MKYFFLAIFSVLLTPAIAFAQASAYFSDFKSFVQWIIPTFIENTILLITALAVLYFFWGVTRYILSQGNQKGRQEGAQIMTRGVIAIFVMMTFWGFVYVITSTFGF